MVDHLGYPLERINNRRDELSFRLKPRERATIHNRLKRVNDLSINFLGPGLQRTRPLDDCQRRYPHRSSWVRQILSIGIHRKNRAIHAVHIFPYRDRKIHPVMFRLFL